MNSNGSSYGRRGEGRLSALKLELLSYLRDKIFSRRDLNRIMDAVTDAINWHRGQSRDNGEPYAIHLLESALILTKELGIHKVNMIFAILFHDTPEDTKVSSRKIRERYGGEVVNLVEPLSKPKRQQCLFPNDEAGDRARHEQYHNVLRLANVLVKILKMCDRLNNLRTLGNCSPEKQQRKLLETKQVYWPLIEDIAIEYPEVARKLKELFTVALREAEAKLARVEI